MTLRTILVSLTSTTTAAALLRSAAVLARRSNAHVIGLYVTESLVVYPGIAMHIPEAGVQSFVASQKAYAEEIKVLFDVEDVAAVNVLLASDAGAGITGSLISIDGGTSPY